MTEVKKKRFRQKAGQVFQIPLSNGKFGYCQLINKSGYAFFNYFDDGNNTDIQKILKNEIIFIIGVDYYIFKEGIWKLLGVFDVDKNIKEKELFTYDYIKEIYLIWRVIDGLLKQIPATPDEIKDLESFSSWSGRAARERLEDYFENRPNYWYERSRNDHNPNFPNIVTFYKQYGYDYKLDIDDE